MEYLCISPLLDTVVKLKAIYFVVFDPQEVYNILEKKRLNGKL